MVESALGQSGSTVQGQHITMRLNQLPADSAGPSVPPTGPDRVASSQAEKQAAAGSIEKYIEPDTRKAGAWADPDTDAAVKAFSNGWLTSGALKKAHETWGDQVQNLMNRLASEKAALRSSTTVLHGSDAAAGYNLRST